MPRNRAGAAVSSVGQNMNEAVDAFLSGEYGRVLEILRSQPKGVQSCDAQLLRARALLRMRENEGAYNELKRMPATTLSLDQRFARRVLVSTARFRLGFRQEALEELGQAVTEVAESERIHPTVRSEVAYFYALALWAERRLEEAHESALGALDPANDIVYVRLLELLGWIEMTRGNLARAARHFATALAALRGCTHHDSSVQAALVHGSIVIAVETLDFSLATLVRAETSDMRWSESDRWRQAQVETYLGRLAEIEGDDVRAWRHFESAKALDVSAPYRAIALVAQANLLDRVGEGFASARLLEDTWHSLKSVTWSSTNAEERIALLAYAYSAAKIDPSTASIALTKARSVWEKDDPLIAFSRDDRVEAMLKQASGAIHLARGDVRRSIADLRVAFDVWIRFDYAVHSVRVAQTLWRLTRELRFRKHIATIAERAPTAWFARLDRDKRGAAILTKLSAAELRVLAALLKGKRPRDIARDFDRSVFTIRNQLKNIFTVFDVHNRAALVAMCAQHDITSQIVDDAAALTAASSASASGNDR